MGRIGLMLVGAALLLLPTPVVAEEPKNKGLFITPLRAYPTVAPGKTVGDSLTVANITNQPANIQLSVEQFSVADYTYDYRFTQVREDWVRLAKTQLTLQPNKSETIPYTIAAPGNATPGGHYFTLFATSQHAGSPNRVRTATVLYVTVEGDLSKTSRINTYKLPIVSLGTDIDFALDVKNTGNAHFFAYTSGRLQGLSAKADQPETTSLLMPGTSRTIGSTIPAPLLPGVYKAVFGYKTDDGHTVQRERLIVYIPPWSILLPIGIVWLVFTFRRYRSHP